jgi:hypothetical protein
MSKRKATESDEKKKKKRRKLLSPTDIVNLPTDAIQEKLDNGNFLPGLEMFTFAVIMDRIDVVRLLVKHGFKIPEDASCGAKSPAMCQALSDLSAPLDITYHIIQENKAIVQAMLDLGARPGLMLAIHTVSYTMTKLLIDNGIKILDYNIRDAKKTILAPMLSAHSGEFKSAVSNVPLAREINKHLNFPRDVLNIVLDKLEIFVPPIIRL